MSPPTAAPAWDARAAGLAIGGLETFAMATADHPLGVTTAVETAAVAVAQAVAPRLTRVNDFIVARDETPTIDWEVGLAAGVVAGSFAAARASGARPRSVPRLWERRFGPSPAKRNAAAFLGGALMIVGARLARGCTSGHAISGTMQLAASSLVFTATMGATAAVVARLLLGRVSDESPSSPRLEGGSR